MDRAEAHFKEELQEGERLVWSGKPEIWPLFGWADFLTIPFALAYVGFFLEFLTIPVPNGSFSFFQAIMIVGLITGLYFGLGRYVLRVFTRRGAFYAVTNARVLALRLFPRRSLGVAYISTISTVTKEVYRNGLGTIAFGETSPWRSWSEDFGFGGSPGLPPIFVNIKNPDRVHALIETIRREATV